VLASPEIGVYHALMSNAAKLKKRAADFEQKKQFDKALALYIQVLQETDGADDDADVALYNRVGDLLLRVGNVSEALTYYERAVDLYAERGFLNNAIALCNKILRQSPGRASIYYKLGRISATKGFKSDAKKNFLEYADRMQKGGQIDEAFRALKEFADLCPDQDDIRLMLAEQLSKENRKDEALEQLQRLHEKLEAEGRAAEARATIDRMKAIDPDVVPRASGNYMSQKSSELVFLDLSYETPTGGRAESTATQASDPDLVAVRTAPSGVSRTAAETAPHIEGFAPTNEGLADPLEVAMTNTLEPTSLIDIDELDSTLATPPEAVDGLLGDFDDPPPIVLDGLETMPIFVDDEPTLELADLQPTALDPTDLETVDLPHDDSVVPNEDGTLTADLPLLIDGRVDFATPAVAPSIADGDLLDADLLDDASTFEASTSLDPDVSFPPLEFGDDGIALDTAPPVPDVESTAADAPAPAADLAWPAMDEEAELEADRPAVDATTASVVNGTSEAILPPASIEARAAAETPRELSAVEALDAALRAEAAQPSRAPDPSTREAAPSPADMARAVAHEVVVTPDAGEPVITARPTPPLVAAVAPPTRETLRDRVSASPNDWSLRRQYAEALFENGDRDGGMRELEQAMLGLDADGNVDGAHAIAEELLALEPNAVRLHQKRVEYAVRSNDRTRLTDAYLELADSLFRTGEAEKARVVYQRVLELAPDNPRAVAAIGTLTSGSPPRGVPASRAGETFSGVNSGSFVNLGALLLEEEGPKSTRMVTEEKPPSGDEDADFAEMLRRFKKGVSENVDDEDFESHYDLGIAYKEMGLMDEAIAEFQKALRGTARRARTYEALGQCFVEKEQYQVAASILKRALALADTDDHQLVGVLYLLGLSYQALDRHRDALDYYQRVFAVDIEFRDVAGRITEMERMAK
jgi:tetratricopeptide (TPR) repeat protein